MVASHLLVHLLVHLQKIYSTQVDAASSEPTRPPAADSMEVDSGTNDETVPQRSVQISNTWAAGSMSITLISLLASEKVILFSSL